MQRTVKLFALARDLAGTDALQVELPPQPRVADLRRALAEQVPSLAPLVKSLLVAVGNDYADDRAPLGDAELACFPPVSGG